MGAKQTTGYPGCIESQALPFHLAFRSFSLHLAVIDSYTSPLLLALRHRVQTEKSLREHGRLPRLPSPPSSSSDQRAPLPPFSPLSHPWLPQNRFWVPLLAPRVVGDPSGVDEPPAVNSVIVGRRCWLWGPCPLLCFESL